MENPNQTQKDIATKLGITAGRVSQIVRSNRLTDRLLAETHKSLKLTSVKAAKTIEDAVEQRENWGVALDASKTVLKHAGVIVQDERSQTSVNVNVFQHMTEDELRNIVVQGQAIPQENIVDAELVDTTQFLDGQTQ